MLAYALAVVLVVLVIGAPSAQAAPVTCGADLSGSHVDEGCIHPMPGTPGDHAESGGGGGEGGGASGPRYRYRYVVACTGNDLNEPNATLCEEATTQCAAPRLLYWQYRSQDGTTWQYQGTRCLTRQEAQDGEALPGLTLEDFRRLPIPAQEVLLEPGNGYALVGVPLNVVAGTAPALLQTQLLGAAVSVRATPVAWHWDFGDGTALGPLADPGAAYPALGTTHTYERGGTLTVTLTTTYAGEYSVDGGAFAPVPGTADVVSVPVPLDVLTGGGALVQDPTG